MRDSSKTMYLGVDGGGTKTEYLLINGRGTIAAHVKTETSHHLQRGVVGAVSIIRNGIEQGAAALRNYKRHRLCVPRAARVWRKLEGCTVRRAYQ